MYTYKNPSDQAEDTKQFKDSNAVEKALALFIL